MDTTLLKSFATSSRTELIREVAARITAVLAPGSPERVEQPRAVSELERAISVGGGGDKGKAHVTDKVAYTWFNRIIALRFMDANGYTGIGVVSPAADQVGQPEILAAAKRGQVDGDVVKGANVATVTGLLNGTRQPRPGVDAQAEAYSLLLADYCRYWNRAMPFMFEREGDYTELLIPANVLAEDSVLSRSVTVLTEEVCQDVEVIGWLYQFYISERKDEVFAGFKKNKKAGADEIPAATQLFTPHWIVRYLVENSVGRLWMLNHPESRLVDQMDYYIAPVDEETDFLKITKPEELMVIDPACGSGHMLTYAFDLLYAIYEEEGYTPSQIPGLILTNNLYGTEIDPRAGALAAFALTMKAAAKRKLFLKDSVEPNICVLAPIAFTVDELSYLVTENGDRHAEEAFWNQFAQADTFGSLIQPDPDLTERLNRYLATLNSEGDLLRADSLARAQRLIHQATYLAPRYSAVVANPPYMGSKSYSSVLRDFASTKYSKTWTDLCTMFVERSLALVEPGGVASLVTSESWIFTSSFAEMRSMILKRSHPLSCASIDKSAFGVVLNVAAIVLLNLPRREAVATFFRVSPAEIKAGVNELPPRNGPLYNVAVSDFEVLPGAPFAFDFPPDLLHLYRTSPTVGSVFSVKQGLATGDNERFVRYWWEVSLSRMETAATSREEAALSGRRWFLYNKGGTPVAWWGNQYHVVDWAQDGSEIIAEAAKKWGSASRTIKNTEYYFRPSVTWSKTGAKGARFRYLPAGSVFDINGMSIFSESEERLLDVLGYLNSQIARDGLDVLSPTLTYQSGDVGRLPMPAGHDGREVVRSLVEIAQRNWAQSEISHGFESLQVARGAGSLKTRVRAVVETMREDSARTFALEKQNNDYWNSVMAAEVGDESGRPVELHPAEPRMCDERTILTDLVSYAVGCMFGRYSIDKPGLILADQGANVQDFFAKVPSPRLMPDDDNVLPILDADWFEDDIVERFSQFLRAAFGEQHFEENLQFVTKSLGVKHLRDYFVKSFYKDHVKRYKKRPIYWLFSSPKGSFNALIYMHRYTPSTVSTVLTYLREYVTKLESALQQAERAGNAKEADRLRKILVELNEYEHDTLFPKASENIVIDLDDGVKVNYPKFGAALKKIPGLEASSD